jgi:branched-chain amino acid aminotransferase/4-amino-4-deoxychorismate lyase
MKAIYNSRILNKEEINLNISNRAFCYGDGLFETIVTGPDRLNLTALHMARLKAACALLDMKMPLDQVMLEEQIKTLRTENKLTGQIRVRIQLWRNAGGLYEPLHNDTSYLITVSRSDKAFYSKINSLSLSKKASVSFHTLSFAKTMSALPYVLAGVERKAGPYDDLVILDGQGHIAECVASNIFWTKGSEVFTPDLRSGCVDGTMRQYIISQLEKKSIGLQEVLEPVAALYEADTVFLSNASGIQWVEHYEDQVAYSDPEKLLQRAAILPLLP